MELTVLSWNLFHGRDFPPDPRLLTWRSRLLRVSERNATHIQVNRELRDEFAALLAHADWDVALLQECPPRFCAPLARACAAQPHRRAHLPQLARPAALARRPPQPGPDRLRRGRVEPDPGPIRGAAGPIVERRDAVIHDGPSERRTMAFTRTASGVCFANLHASAHVPERAAADVLLAAERATEWAGDAPLVFGGDLNLRPAATPHPFEELERRHGLAGTTAPAAIDHLLSRRLTVVEPPRQWPPEQREVRGQGFALRLSDHAPVEAKFAA